jgi:hypothetical protein
MDLRRVPLLFRAAVIKSKSGKTGERLGFFLEL